MKRYRFWTAVLSICLVLRVSAQEPDSTTLTKIGQIPPDFSVATLDGRHFSASGYKGKIVLLIFFATWCPACQKEFPDLQKNLWEKFRDSGLIVLAIGREHTWDELEKFRKDNGYTFDFAPDPKRGIFNLYATRNIPRNVLIGKDGTIAYQSLGYEPGMFRVLVDKVSELSKS